MLPDRVSNPGPLTYESGALPIALRGPARKNEQTNEHTNGRTDARQGENYIPLGINTRGIKRVYM